MDLRCFRSELRLDHMFDSSRETAAQLLYFDIRMLPRRCRDQLMLIARSGQLLAASRAFASNSGGTSGVVTNELPSSSIENTSGQMSQQRA
jgi:hypothetical protein